jgi:hypothetical protein
MASCERFEERERLASIFAACSKYSKSGVLCGVGGAVGRSGT